MYHGYISPLILLLKGLRAEGELRLANREIQCLVTEIPNRLDEGGGVGGGGEPTRKFRKAVEHFQAIWFKSSYFFNLSQTRDQKLCHLSVSDLQLLTQDKLQPQGQIMGIFSPPECQHESSFPGPPSATWAVRECRVLDGAYITIPDLPMQ